jgi:hypothetical protein
MCDYCIRTETIEELENRHAVQWCEGCNRYFPIEDKQCAVCLLIDTSVVEIGRDRHTEVITVDTGPVGTT